jgi:hypothetical protein
MKPKYWVIYRSVIKVDSIPLYYHPRTAFTGFGPGAKFQLDSIPLYVLLHKHTEINAPQLYFIKPCVIPPFTTHTTGRRTLPTVYTYTLRQKDCTAFFVLRAHYKNEESTLYSCKYYCTFTRSLTINVECGAGCVISGFLPTIPKELIWGEFFNFIREL